MSRVSKPGQKFVNSPRYDDAVYQPSKITRLHWDGEDYHKAHTLSAWLFMKYDMSYKAYRNKTRARRDKLRAEFYADTGAVPEEITEEWE